MSTNLQFIKQVSAESVVFLNTGQIFTAEYDTYFVQMEIAGTSTYNEIYLTDSSNARLNDSSDDAHYDNAMRVLKSDTSASANNAENAYVGWREIGVYINNQNKGYGMSFYVHNPFDSSKYTFIISQSVGYVGTAMWAGKAIGSYKSAEQCNGLYLSNSGGGTMDYIKANIYGIVKV